MVKSTKKQKQVQHVCPFLFHCQDQTPRGSICIHVAHRQHECLFYADVVCRLRFSELLSGSLCNFPKLDSNEQNKDKIHYICGQPVTFDVTRKYWAKKMQAHQDIACVENSHGAWCYMSSIFVYSHSDDCEPCKQSPNNPTTHGVPKANQLLVWWFLTRDRHFKSWNNGLSYSFFHPIQYVMPARGLWSTHTCVV